MKKPLIIFGLRDLAELAFEYFTHDSDFEVVAFTVHEAYLPESRVFCSLPVVPFEHIEDLYPADRHHFFAALSYQQMNRQRERIVQAFKAKGFRPASYISSHCFRWHNCKFGEHVFIFEDNTLQPFVEIGNNVILWSGNHIGHSSVIGDHTFISSHVVVSGFCRVGSHCFIGVNSTLANDTEIGDNCWVSQGSIMSGKVPAHQLVRSDRSPMIPLDEERLFKKLSNISEGRQDDAK